MLAVEMTTHEDPQAGAATAAGLLGELQGDEAGGDHVVATDDALVLDAEDMIEIDAAEGHEGRGGPAPARPEWAAGDRRGRRR